MKEIKRGGLRRRFAVGAAGARSGLGLLSSQATGLLLTKKEQKAHKEKALEREANRFVAELGELKGAYVKIGQMLALYGEHILPQAVTRALHRLESQTSPLDWSAIETELQSSLDEGKLAQLDIDSTPFAAASLSQVHLAKMPDVHENVCVKIQYPNVADTIDDDFKSVVSMLTLTRWIKSVRQFDSLMRELKAYLVKEIDYQRELNTAQRITAYLAQDQRYLVPHYHTDLCCPTVLTMQFVEGYDVTHACVQSLNQQRRNHLALAMLELFFKEMFDWQLMQTDPNFGNYRIVIDEDGENDRLALLDFGAVHELSDGFSASLKKTILAAQDENTGETIAGLVELKCLREHDSDNVKLSFAQFCSYLLEPFKRDLSQAPEHARTAEGLYDWYASGLLKRAGKLGSESVLVNGFAIPPAEFMLMVRKLTGVFTFVSALRAELDCADLLDRYR